MFFGKNHAIIQRYNLSLLMVNWKYLLSFGIAFFIFIGLLISENGSYSDLEKVKDPFENAEELKDVVTVLAGVPPQEMFTSQGEYWKVFEESEVDFVEGNRELLDGEVFISSLLINEDSFKESQTADTTSLSPKISQLKVGPVLVSFPSASILVSRDPVRSRSQIFVYGHSVEIYWKNALRPFVVPANSVVTIKEKLISEKTSALYYTKIKKEFLLKPFDVKLVGADDPNKEIAEKFNEALGAMQVYEGKMEQYTVALPKTWTATSNNTRFGKSIWWWKNMQANLTIGFPEHKEARDEFKKLVAPFVKAHSLIRKGELEKAEEELIMFAVNLDQPEWKALMAGDSVYAKEWKGFVDAQNGYLRTIYPGDNEKVFVDFWLKVNNADSFERIEKIYSDVEISISGKYLLRAQEVLFTNFRPALEELELEPEYNHRITKIRRLLAETIYNEKSFQNEKVFDLYDFVIEKELSVHTNEDFLVEIRLEIAQNILHFLNEYLQNINVSNILLEIFEKLKVDEISNKLGRNVFNEQELSTIEMINLVGGSGLTPEELKAIKKSQEDQRVMTEKLQEVRKKFAEENQGDTLAGSGYISNSNGLKEFFRDLQIRVDDMKFKMHQKDGENYLINFISGRFLGGEFEGNLKYSISKFLIC